MMQLNRFDDRVFYLWRLRFHLLSADSVVGSELLYLQVLILFIFQMLFQIDEWIQILDL